jgi:aspartate aminotransferase
MLSQRLQLLAPSPTLSLDSKVKTMQAQGIAVVNLGLGEPDFATPDTAKEGAISAIHHNYSHYTVVSGIIELRQAIVKKLAKDNHIVYAPEEIVVGVGTKQLLYHAFQVLCNPGDEVLVPTPTWSTYIEQIKLAGAIPIIIPLKSPFKLHAKDIQKFVTSKTKAIILNSPSNPTGATIDLDELHKIAAIAVKCNFWVISDEIYEKILYSGKHISIASLNSEIKNKTITINGFSKAYAMTGWRIGYAAGPKEVIASFIALQGQTTSNASSISQYAALAALQGSQSTVTKMCYQFGQRRKLVLAGLTKCRGLEVLNPEGAFYVFVSVKKLLNKELSTSATWCQALLEEAHVAVVPGEAFELPGFFRLSFAASPAQLKIGLACIKKFCERIR